MSGRHSEDNYLLLPDKIYFMESNSDWKIDINKALILGDDQLLYAIQQGKDYLNDTIGIRANLIIRINTLISILSVGQISLICWFINLLYSNTISVSWVIELFSLIMIIYLFVILYSLVEIIKGTDYSAIGRQPNSIITQIDIKNNSIANLYAQELSILQGRINKNDQKNKEDWEELNKLLQSLILVPSILFVCFLFCLFFK